jgi:hypothetical protein
MKKNLISIFTVAAIATAAGWNVSRNMSEEALSDVALTNIEALAQNETDPGIRIYCRCTDGNIFGGNKQCKTNGDNAVCAQSEQGGNIDCSTYNSNC